MADDASPETFALCTIYPSWSGVWIVALEQPLRDGLAKLQALLDGATTAIIAVCTQFDYDGVYEKIETIVPIPAGKSAAATAEAMLRTYRARASHEHPAGNPFGHPWHFPATIWRVQACQRSALRINLPAPAHHRTARRCEKSLRCDTGV